MSLNPTTIHTLIVVVVMIVGGALGGLANFFSTKIPKEEDKPLLKRIVLGIIAAFVVPLFLKMISSSILAGSEGWLDYLVLMGFCVIAGFSSKSFLSSVSKQLLDKVETIEEKQAELEEDIDPLLENVTEPEPDVESTRSVLELATDDIKVLRALDNDKYIRRSVKAVERETGLPNIEAIFHLLSLKEKGLVEMRKGRERDLFWLTPRGSQYARSIQE